MEVWPVVASHSPHWQDSRLATMESHFESDLEVLTNEFQSEREVIMEKHTADRKELLNLLDAVAQQEAYKAAEAKQVRRRRCGGAACVAGGGDCVLLRRLFLAHRAVLMAVLQSPVASLTTGLVCVLVSPPRPSTPAPRRSSGVRANA